ncbi:MAG: hypothetical protein M5U26_11475 [Planctomycetota bacterium]|nr:hypothetical protein [Planctomycetota bacterium]
MKRSSQLSTSATVKACKRATSAVVVLPLSSSKHTAALRFAVQR